MKKMKFQPSDLEAFLRAGRSVCPFAAGANRIYARVADAPPFDRIHVRDAAAKFSGTAGQQRYGSLLVQPTGELVEFDTIKTWAREVFLELLVCFALLDGADEGALTEHVTKVVRPVLFDDAGQWPTRPVLACRGLPLYAICMAPVYPPNHPRHLGGPAVVVTWQDDVALAFAQPAVDRIRETMKREHGFVYDADDLMLPLPVPASVFLRGLDGK